MFHPGAARINCDECKRFVFNLESGDKETYRSGPEREELPMVRGPNVPTPCNKCPKEDPENAKQIELSPKNWAAFAHYLQARACGLSDVERRDPIVRRNFALIDMLTRERDRKAQAEEFAEAFVMRLARR
ncbi:MAG: hypothetical protein L0211_09160 [Planctomycetaceae bacterium]|nr:hypothetical protein [Planctomycetaceae bacterium]